MYVLVRNEKVTRHPKGIRYYKFEEIPPKYLTNSSRWSGNISKARVFYSPQIGVVDNFSNNYMYQWKEVKFLAVELK